MIKGPCVARGAPPARIFEGACSLGKVVKENGLRPYFGISLVRRPPDYAVCGAFICAAEGAAGADCAMHKLQMAIHVRRLSATVAVRSRRGRDDKDEEARGRPPSAASAPNRLSGPARWDWEAGQKLFVAVRAIRDTSRNRRPAVGRARADRTAEMSFGFCKGFLNRSSSF
ncbi:hypothetical protein EVAR_51593_1 [Eumeta japonica]|uniref:Uncharacterized protein n=1 Tax=Eumeta variegata TaxID=151549 RepID=A0A4C1YEW5_EUMVA|nr:hypothetical protein EVAR_51593_1 [Eumeta japonica]